MHCNFSLQKILEDRLSMVLYVMFIEIIAVRKCKDWSISESEQEKKRARRFVAEKINGT